MNLKTYKYAILALLLTGSSFAVQAESHLYRYKDQHDTTVIGLSVPPEFVSKGYDILNRQGRVIQHVAPALTPAQIKARDEREKALKLKALQAKQQRIKDEELLRLYSQPDDAVRILKRKIQDIKDLIALKKSNTYSHQNQKEVLEKKAADLQRSGRKIPDSLLSEIKVEASKITSLKEEIKAQQVKMKQTYETFDQKITRLELLTGHKAENYKHLKPES
jgi:ribosomal protein S21